MSRVSRLITTASLALSFAIAMNSSALAANRRQAQAMRMDCRFYNKSVHLFCYSSAVYEVAYGKHIEDIRFGVGCNYETIYDDGGSSDPQEKVSDSIRPKTSAFPRVELFPEGALRKPGTYTSKLEIPFGKLEDGICYVSEFNEDDEDYLLFNGAWFTPNLGGLR